LEASSGVWGEPSVEFGFSVGVVPSMAFVLVAGARTPMTKWLALVSPLPGTEADMRPLFSIRTAATLWIGAGPSGGNGSAKRVDTSTTLFPNNMLTCAFCKRLQTTHSKKPM